jgi:uncharacterized protein
MLDANQVKSLLSLQPHPAEGGYFRETYRSADTVHKDRMPGRYPGARSFSTAIYYLLTPDTFSALHRLPTDEIYHFYLGDPIEMLQLLPDGSGRIIMLGNDILNGMQPQVVIPKGVWQGSRLLAGGDFCLLGATMAPGFEFEDYEPGNRESLISLYPQFSDKIQSLTR